MIVFMDEFYQVYGQFSAWKLRNMTHDEPPWKAAINNGGVISQKSMQRFFKTQVVDNEEEEV